MVGSEVSLREHGVQPPMDLPPVLYGALHSPCSTYVINARDSSTAARWKLKPWRAAEGDSESGKEALIPAPQLPSIQVCLAHMQEGTGGIGDQHG